MYKPVKPLILTPIRGEKRPMYPLTGWGISGRVNGQRVEVLKKELQLRAKALGKSLLFYWEPKDVKSASAVKSKRR
jgi:hypothetical protein